MWVCLLVDVGRPCLQWATPFPRKRVLNRRDPGEHKEVDKYKCFASFSAKTVDIIGSGA